MPVYAHTCTHTHTHTHTATVAVSAAAASGKSSDCGSAGTFLTKGSGGFLWSRFSHVHWEMAKHCFHFKPRGWQLHSACHVTEMHDFLLHHLGPPRLIFQEWKIKSRPFRPPPTQLHPHTLKWTDTHMHKHACSRYLALWMASSLICACSSSLHLSVSQYNEYLALEWMDSPIMLQMFLVRHGLRA